MKVVINRCFGGFQLSKKAYEYLGLPWDGHGFEYDDDRTNPKLVECVEKLGPEASSSLSHLVVVEIPAGIDWYIDNYDGMETIAEQHRVWY